MLGEHWLPAMILGQYFFNFLHSINFAFLFMGLRRQLFVEVLRGEGMLESSQNKEEIINQC